MKKSEIQVGKTYINKGSGTTTRTVLAIDDYYKPDVYWNATGKNPRKNDTGVLFRQGYKNRKLYLSSFAAWCSREVEQGE
jgi:hypothetical protein